MSASKSETGRRRGRRPAVRGGQPARQLRMAAKVSEGARDRLDARAERAGLALGAWVGLFAEDVALGRPVVAEEQLAALAAGALRVARLGGAVNQLAAGEHVGRPAGEAELAAVLGRASARIAEAGSAVAAVAAVFAAGGAASGRADEAPERASGRRTPAAGAEDRRARQVKAKVTAAEYDLVAAAAAREGLAVGAWLGLLLEDRRAVRPVMGEAWGTVFGLRKALRRLATNLAQIEASRAARGCAGHALLGRVRREADDAIRACLALSAAISDAAGAGAAA